MDSSSNSSTTEEIARLLDAPDFCYYDCDSHRHYSSLLRRRRSAPPRDFICCDVETESCTASDGSEFGVIRVNSSSVENSDELEVDFETSEEDSEVVESTKDLIELFPDEEENDLGVIDSSGDSEKDTDDTDVTDSGRDRVDPFHDENCMSGEKSEESMVTMRENQRDDYAGSAPPQLQEPNSTDWYFLLFLAGLVIKTIEFLISFMISFVTSPSWFLHPLSTIKLGRRLLKNKIAGRSDMIFGTMNPLKLNWLKDTKQVLNIACKFGYGLFWAIYVAIVLFGLLVSALVLGGFMIKSIADKPFAVKEILNFDYTKNSPEAYVPLTSCAGVSCDGSCKESNEMQKIRGLRIIPKDHKLDLILSMTLPESLYNKNLGMFQVRVDFLSADGQSLGNIRRPCMLRFRSEPIRLLQTFFKMVPLMTGYVSEIQTMSLKLKGFIEKDIPTACLKIMIEQRAEFHRGAGIPELYDASLSLESDLPFLKNIIWKWRKTFFVWISMSLFTTELLFALVFCRSLILPRTRRGDRSALNPMESK